MATPPTDRFSEEKSADTVRGAGLPDIDAGVAAIRTVLRTLPARPGVYRMLDQRGDVLYVGKARALKARVTSYIQITRLPRRLQRMVAQTRGMTIVTTNTEAEALLLEAQLIKRFRPAYNVLLRDDKSFPFIFLGGDHPFPRVTKHRGARRGQGQYYGPFASAGAVTRTLNALQKIFLLRSCSDSFFQNRSRPCLLYQIRRCSAPCVGRIDEAAYGELVDDARAFLSGRSTEVQKKLQDQARHLYGDNASMSKELWSQFLSFQGPAMQSMMSAYMDQSKKMFQQMQDQLQSQTRNMFTAFPLAGVPDKSEK